MNDCQVSLGQVKVSYMVKRYRVIFDGEKVCYYSTIPDWLASRNVTGYSYNTKTHIMTIYIRTL